jgi:hypothetical protein
MFSLATVCVCVRDVLIARFYVVLRVRRDSPSRGERRLVLRRRTETFASYSRPVQFVTYSRRVSHGRNADSRHLMFNV